MRTREHGEFCLREGAGCTTGNRGSLLKTAKQLLKAQQEGAEMLNDASLSDEDTGDGMK